MWCPKKPGPAQLAVAVVLLWVCSMPAFADLIAATLEYQNPAVPIERAPPVDAIIVLGGDIASPRGRLAEAELGNASDRLFGAYCLWQAGKAKAILVSGGNMP